MDTFKILKFCSLFLSLARKSSFDVRYFYSLSNIEDIDAYAKENLMSISSGTSRNVYLLSPKKALKIAKPKALEPGIEQNKVESDMSDRFKSFGISSYTKVHSHHPNFLWIVSDLVRPCHDLNELCSSLGIKTEDMFSLFAPAKFKRKPVQNPPQELLKLKSLVESGDLGRDIMKSDSWGVNADGKAVLLDYGMSKSVFDQFYSKDSDYKWPDNDDEEEI